MNAIFQLHHIAISVSDIQRSESFYTLFGFIRVHQWEAEDDSLTIVHMKNEQGILLELFHFTSSQPAPLHTSTTKTDLPVIGVKHFGLQVDSLEQAKQFVAEQGIEQVTDIATGKTGIQYFFIKDPDGILVEIVQDDRHL